MRCEECHGGFVYSLEFVLYGVCVEPCGRYCCAFWFERNYAIVPSSGVCELSRVRDVFS